MNRTKALKILKAYGRPTFNIGNTKFEFAGIGPTGTSP